MTRKEFLRTASIASLGMVAAPLVSRAMNTNAESLGLGAFAGTLETIIEIGNNHGHALVLDVEAIVVALRVSNTDGFVNFDIQGESRHPHTLKLTQLELIKLLAEGRIEKESSEDFGHSHLVTIAVTETV